MSAFSQVALSKVEEMLEHCAPGAEWEAKEHRHWVRWQGKTYRGIPLGPHGRRAKVTIAASHVRTMIRHLNIDPNCAARFVPIST